MVSIGTIITLGVVGAIVAGGVAVYANAGKISGAFSRGVETNLTAPLGSYLDNLWKGVVPGSSSSTSSTSTTSSAALEAARQSGIATAQARYQQEFGQTIRSYQDALQVFQQQYTSFSPNQVAYALPPNFPGEEHRGANPTAPPNEPLFAPSPSGYYYRNFAPGGRADTQIKLKEGSADALRKRGYDLFFLHPTQKLSQAGFFAFGKSKGYL